MSTIRRYDVRPSRPLLVWVGVVAVVYGLATAATAMVTPPRVDTATVIAQNLLHGQASIGYQPTALDTVTRDGQTYHIIGLGPVLAYLPLAPFPALETVSRWIVSLVFGVLAASLAWPFAAAFGPEGRTRWWLAALVAFGTLLFPLSARGSFFYLAHSEAMAATLACLIEWQGRRRPWVIGLAIGLGALARPTLLLALLPLGGRLLWTSRGRLRTAVALAAPTGAALAAIGAWNAVRFGSPLETGYTIAVLHNAVLIEARARGAFSLRHVGPNLATLIGGGFDVQARFPWLVPSAYGHSILLTTPALLAVAGAPWRDHTSRVLVASAGLITMVLLAYYGGAGFHTYGYRYFLDATPFLLALVALAARRGFGATEQALIVLSVAFCSYGVLAGILRLG